MLTKCTIRPGIRDGDQFIGCHNHQKNLLRLEGEIGRLSSADGSFVCTIDNVPRLSNSEPSGIKFDNNIGIANLDMHGCINIRFWADETEEKKPLRFIKIPDGVPGHLSVDLMLMIAEKLYVPPKKPEKKIYRPRVSKIDKKDRKPGAGRKVRHKELEEYVLNELEKGVYHEGNHQQIRISRDNSSYFIYPRTIAAHQVIYVCYPQILIFP